MSPGIYGLSNHLLDTPWPKVVKGKDEFFDMLGDRTAPSDSELPDTGMGLQRERMLSPVFVSSPDYGTRSSTILLIDQDDSVTFMEKTFNGETTRASTVGYDFRIE